MSQKGGGKGQIRVGEAVVAAAEAAPNDTPHYGHHPSELGLKDCKLLLLNCTEDWKGGGHGGGGGGWGKGGGGGGAWGKGEEEGGHGGGAQG